MDERTRSRNRLEKAGFSGRDLETAMAVMEQLGSYGFITRALAGAVEKNGLTPSMALYELRKTLEKLSGKLEIRLDPGLWSWDGDRGNGQF